MQAITAKPAIATEVYASAAMPYQIGPQTSAQLLDVWIEQFLIRNATDVVLAENPRLQHYLRIVEGKSR